MSQFQFMEDCDTMLGCYFKATKYKIFRLHISKNLNLYLIEKSDYSK